MMIIYIIIIIINIKSRAREILTVNRPLLEKLANLLQEKEVINREEVTALMGK